MKVLPSEIKDKRLLDRFIFKISNFSFGLELVCRIRNWLKVGMSGDIIENCNYIKK